MPLLAVALSLLVPMGCADEPEPARSSTTVDTIAGVVHVRHGGQVPVRELEPVLAIGAVGGLGGEPSPEEFGRVANVIADADGRVYVSDGLALEIRVFGPDGEFLRRLGREGGGPGEIAGLHGATWLGDTLVVVDYGNARLMRLTTDGEHVGQWPWLRIGGSSRFFHHGGPGELFAYAIRAEADEQGSRSAWVRHTREGPSDTLGVPRMERPAGSNVMCEAEGIISFFDNPFADRLLAAPAPGGERVVALASEYRLAFLDPAGDTLRVLTREIERAPIPDSVWDALEADYREFREDRGGWSCEGSIERPPHRPVLRDIFFAHDGRMLVEHTTAEGVAFDLFDGDGEWLATIPVPDRDDAVPPFLRDDRLYMATRDSLDVQRVEGFRLRPAGGGG